MTSVRVLCPIGEYHVPRATADEFTTGVLTVTFLDSLNIAREFAAHQWIQADVIGEDGYPAFTLLKEKGRG